MPHPAYPHIFEPLEVGGVVFKNRVFCAPSMAHMVQNNAPTYPEEPFVATYLEKAKGGVAQVNCGGQQVNDPGRNPIHSNLDIADPTGWRNFIHMTDDIHACDARCSYELLHFGSEGEFTEEARRGTIYGCSDFVRADGVHFREMPYEEMDRLADRYADLAECVAFCGFDTLLIHGGHGTLLQEFVSPRSNRRTDEFGGSMENRARFPLMVLDRIRARVGRDLLIEYRISGSECVPGGLEVADCIEFLKLVQDRIDIAHISAGVVRMPRLRAVTHPTGFLPEAANAHLAKAVKACPDIRVPVLTVGAFQRPEAIERVLAAGEADIVVMARGTIADPATVAKARDGRPQDIVPCIKCFRCLDEFKTTHRYSCSVNPLAGRETRVGMLEPRSYRRMAVAVVGGGPAGMEAALRAAARGHTVTLFEREAELGGRLNEACAMPFKYDLARYRDYLVEHVKADDAIAVHLGVVATPELVASYGFDAVLAAVGAEEVIPGIEGIDRANVLLAGDALLTPGCVGEHVAIIGGGEVGCEVAVHLAMEGRSVTVLEMGPELAPAAMRTYREELLGQVADRCATVLRAEVQGVGEEGVRYRDAAGGKHVLEADTVVLACGMRARSGAAERFRGCAGEFRRLGDCARVGHVGTAARDAFDAALTLGRLPGA